MACQRRSRSGSVIRANVSSAPSGTSTDFSNGFRPPSCVTGLIFPAPSFSLDPSSLVPRLHWTRPPELHGIFIFTGPGLRWAPGERVADEPVKLPRPERIELGPQGRHALGIQ